ncbi:MAG: ComF family protein [Nitrospinota bacterium]|nr:ComF family protein [Nitrospinota bacterium]
MINQIIQSPRLTRVCESIVNAVFPRSCVGCGLNRKDGGDYLCGLCRDDIFVIGDPLCETCGIPADIDYDYPAEGFECGWCRKGGFRFDRARSLGLYDSVLKELIHFYKYRNQPGAINEIEPYLRDYFETCREEYQGYSVASVPLHVKKLKERGFDQSFVLAHKISEILDLPLLTRPIRRIRETLPQARKNRTERFQNVRGAFDVVDAEAVLEKNILLIDDVFTTGSTVNEVTRMLKQARAGCVQVFTLARA